MPKPYQPRDYRAEHEARQQMLATYRAAKAAILNQNSKG